MTRLRRIVMAGAIVAAASSAQAAAVDCRNATTQSDMNQCAGQGARAADAKLNAIYKRVLDRLGAPAPRKLLVDAQRAWVAFRDAECAFAASGVDGGSIYPMIVSGCLEALTDKRRTDLQAYLYCQNGDLGCPVPPR